MNGDWRGNGPVVVGGLGGSGTRVVAEIMAACGYHIGRDLNAASDNLWFTFLFKRPLWYPQHRDDRETLETGLSLLEKLMLRSSLPTAAEWRFFMEAFRSIAAHGFNYSRIDQGHGKWARQRAVRMLLRAPARGRSFVGWGWKEPNSHLLIEDMAAHFPGFRYVHTVRHGLDMAFSGNQEQLRLWGGLYGVNVPADADPPPSAAYRYWVNANRLAVKRGRALAEGRFLLVNFDRLCDEPRTEVARLADFLGVPHDGAALDRLVSFVRPQATTGRYRQHGLDSFAGEDLSALGEFGFSL